MTPAINLLKKNKCEFKIHKYKHDPACTDYGNEAASELGVDENRVFKTLLVELSPKELVVCVLPVNKKLFLKAISNFFKAKNATMADKQEAQKVTGYLLGGISPLGQKKRLKTLIDKSILDFETIFVSGGKRGLDIEVLPSDLEALLSASFKTITT
jgi:Cys-tRNA(Pro)/Cys-tRNA(Cys) deacylase